MLDGRAMIPARLGKNGLPMPHNVILFMAVLATVFLLLRSFSVGPFAPDAHFMLAPHDISHEIPRITKVTERIEPLHELYEATLRSHEAHDRLNGYEMRLFKEQWVEVYHSRPTYLLSIIIEELQKPLSERKQWLAWFDADVVLLNPQIPLAIFLPPVGHEHVKFLATQDDKGFDTAMFFIRVDPWSVRLLTDVLSHRKSDHDMRDAETKHQKAFDLTLRSNAFRSGVVYQPRTWYNAYGHDLRHPEISHGALLAHFTEPSGDKWAAMGETLQQLADSPEAFSVPVGETRYAQEVPAFWARIEEAYHLLPLADAKMDQWEVKNAHSRLQFAMTYETDKEQVVKDAIDSLRTAVTRKVL